MKVAILGSGMMTGVGLSSPAACAAMRAGISGFVETRFKNSVGEWTMGCQVPLGQPWRGRAKLAQLVVSPIRECLALAAGTKPGAIPLLLCVAEEDRPGRPQGLDERFLLEVENLLARAFHPRSSVIAQGRLGGAIAVDRARKLIHEVGVPRCIVAGVDSFLVAQTLSAYEAKSRLLTSKNSNGFIPGEAGAAVLLGPPGSTRQPELLCTAIGFGREKASIDSEEPLRADGLVEAYRALRSDGGVSLDDADYRITGCNGEQYWFKDDRLAFSRTVRKLKQRFDHVHPADSIGEVGAAIGPCALGVALAAAQKGYAPGNGEKAPPGKGVLCQFSNDAGDRAALLLRYGDEEDRHGK
jgi:3-oxoacyl-[acyl-carrier-protein] synthase I